MKPPPDIDADKTAFREWAIAEREGLDWPELSRAIVASLREWPPLAAASTALGYLPLPNEIDLQPLLEGPSLRWVATRTPDREGSLTIHELGGPLVVHRYGFLQPHPSAPQVAADSVDVFLVPGLAFDLFGNRLGRGAGYFDGLLSGARQGAFTVGVVPSGLVVDQLPVEPHDVVVGYLATEEGVVKTAI